MSTLKKELKEIRIDANKHYVGFFPNGDKIKQIHVAGGALRVIYGKTLNTKKIKSLAFVAGKKHKDAPVPNVFPIDQLIKDTECFDEKPDDDDLLSMRKMLQKLLNTDGGMFPDDSQLTYSAGSKYFIKGHSQLEDAGEFIGKVINKYCPELAQYIRDVLSNADDPISVLFCPVEDEEETVISAGQGLNDLKAFVNQNAAMKWYLSSIKESGECLKGNLEKMPNTLTQLRTFIFFCTFQLVRYFSLLEAFNCDGKILPFLLDFSDNPASGIATASTASYARVYQSVSRFYSWAFAQELKDYPKSELMTMDTPVYDSQKRKREDNSASTNKKKLQAERAEYDSQWELAKENAKSLDSNAAKLEFGKTLYNMASMQASSYPVAYLRVLGAQGGVVYPTQRDSKRKRFKLSQDTFEMVIRSCVGSNETITYDQLRERMWTRFNIVINGIPEGAFNDPGLADLILHDNELGSDVLEDNHQRCVKALEDMDFADLMADGILQVHLGGTN